MRRFVQLFDELDGTTQTARKEAALEHYFSTADPTEAAWVLFFLLGRRLRRPVPLPTLRSWVAAEAGLPAWLVEECCNYVGDQGEALALLLPPPAEPKQITLAALIVERILPLRDMEETARRSVVAQTWRELGTRERFLFFKLLGGSFRVGVAEGLVARALARVAGLPPAVMAHRLMGDWQPSAEWFRRLLSASERGVSEPGKPYPFLLASPLTDSPATLGPCADWQVEWKWDGIRAQGLHRHGEVLIWSRGEELLTERFPEIAQAVASLPTGTVLDGEILAWTNEAPLPFALLQKRISRKRVDVRWQREIPCVFLAFDLLEAEGQDLRGEPLVHRRRHLEKLLSHRPRTSLRLAPILPAADWSAVAAARAAARHHGVEGVMLKRRTAAYAAGRIQGIWWKWKLEPRTVDAVLLSGQLGRGRRADLHTDYTFGVWDGQELVPIAKAYSGLSDAEIRQVDQFIKANTISQHGPVRWVRPELVFEIAFEGIQWSSRHRAGLALRFPRINRWRTDKTAEQADRLDTLRTMLPPKPDTSANQEAEDSGLFAHIVPESSS